MKWTPTGIFLLIMKWKTSPRTTCVCMYYAVLRYTYPDAISSWQEEVSRFRLRDRCFEMGVFGGPDHDAVCCHKDCYHCGGKSCTDRAHMVGLEGSDCCVGGIQMDRAAICGEQGTVGPCVLPSWPLHFGKRLPWYTADYTHPPRWWLRMTRTDG